MLCDISRKVGYRGPQGLYNSAGKIRFGKFIDTGCQVLRGISPAFRIAFILSRKILYYVKDADCIGSGNIGPVNKTVILYIVNTGAVDDHGVADKGKLPEFLRTSPVKPAGSRDKFYAGLGGALDSPKRPGRKLFSAVK